MSRAPVVLVTAGPTREPIDAVRCITNESSGKMGYAVAEAAARAGGRVTLVSGPVALPAPRGVRVVRVTTAREMRAAALRAFRGSDLAFHAAAVADFRPARLVRGKIKKGASLVLTLVANPDILGECGRRKHKSQVLVGFALEAAHGERNARRKLAAKNLDFVVLNDPSALNADRAHVTVLTREGMRLPMSASKRRLGETIVRLAIKRWQRPPHATRPPKRSR